MLEYRDGPDRISRTTYDDFGRVASVVSGYGVTGAITESLTYTDNGQVETLTDGEGNLTTWAYDGFDRTYRMYYPNPSSSGSSTTDYEQITYDADGLLYSTRTRDNQLFYYSFNALGQPDYVNAPSPQLDVQTYYDQLGSPFQINTVGTGGQTLDQTHDVLGRLLVEDGPLGDVTYWWDSGSRLVRITWPDAYYAEYLYDLTGAMTQVRENGASSGAGLLAQYAYDNLGRRTSTARGNGAGTAYGWDGASRLTSLAIDLSSTTQDATWTLEYNPAGQVIERALSNSAYAYTDDATISDAYANDGLNRVTAVDTTSVTYDSRFNITGDGTSTWSYDPSNRLTGSGSAAMTYDPLGRLYSTTGPAERLQYAGAQIIGAYNSSGGLIERYVPGAGLDDYAAWTTGTGGGITRQWPMTDPLGSVVARTSGSAVGTLNSYDEYGVPASTNGGRFGYAGALRLTQTGDAPWHMRNRQYHAELGRFLQTDPIGIAGGVNLYAYVGGDPVNLVDPWGLQEPVLPGETVWGCRISTGNCPPCYGAPRDIVCTNDPWTYGQVLDAISQALDNWWQNGNIASTMELMESRQCTPVRETFAERALGVGQGLADLTTLGALISGHFGIAAASNRASMGIEGIQFGIDVAQRDRAGVTSSAAGLIAGSVPVLPQPGTGPAVFDAGRRLDGTFMPNSAGRRQAAEAGQRIAQGTVGSQAAQRLCPPQ